RKELVRLLYVGMTRARDFLIFAVASKRRGGNSTAWLDFLIDGTGRKIIKLPTQNGAGGYIDVRDNKFPVVVSTFEPVGGQKQKNLTTAYIYPMPEETKEFPPAHFTPSSQNYTLDKDILPESIRIGNHLPIIGNPDMQALGEAIHTFLAVDNVGELREKRLLTAEAMLKRWQTTGLAAESLIEASNQLWSYIGSTFGESCVNKREWPVHLRVRDQKAEGWIDLLLETPEGFVIIDHKSFPGTEEKCLKRAVEYAPQVSLYKEAVELATGRTVLDTFIHLPVSGLMVRLKRV
ncbi:MAG: PD-(D/E)XK nuclease family protein, partial [Syntrophobacteraceae bacterium]